MAVRCARFLCVALVLSLSGCGSDTVSDTPGDQDANQLDENNGDVKATGITDNGTDVSGIIFSGDKDGGPDVADLSDTVDAGPVENPFACDPGETQPCDCPGTFGGVQECTSDGIWGSCGCDAGSTNNNTDTQESPQPDTNTNPLVPDTLDGNGDGNGDDGQCNERTLQVYLLSNSQQLLRFSPGTLDISVVGTLNCPGVSSPFSMSVDNYADAWILYQPGGLALSGTLFKASTVDASCVSTTYTAGQGGLDLFGMGFVADNAGGNNESLYMSGGTIANMFNPWTGSATVGFNATLNSIKTDSLNAVSNVGTIPGGMGTPELTGTGNGELWGFFPVANPPVVAKISKTDATIGDSYDLSSLNIGQAKAYAFAFWGGDFYLFLQTTTDTSTNFWKVAGATGDTSNIIPNSGYTIVGAGVSTCAPTENPAE